MKRNKLKPFVLFVFPYLATLGVIVFAMHPAWLMSLMEKGIYICYDGNALTDPFVFSLNVLVPLGLLAHLVAVVLALAKYKKYRWYVIMWFLFFISVVCLIVIFGSRLFFIWLGGYFPLTELVWWLF